MKKYTQLTEGERNQIYALHKEGFNDSAIAKRIGRSQSTVSRELQRNRGGRGYRPGQAQKMASERRAQASRENRKISEQAQQFVLEKLTCEQWSPEQIAGRIEKEIGETVSYEWIYKFIYADRKNGGDLFENLRHGRKKRKKRCCPSPDRAGRGHIKNRRDISERPGYVDKRITFGNWEIDTIIGKNHSGAAVTVVERQTRYTVLIPLQNRKSDLVAKETINVFRPVKDCVCSITADNGKEFALHEEIADKLDLDFYFATPYRSCERGTNENTNGLIRQYIPKNRSIDDITYSEAQHIMDKLNHRPRKTLDYRTPSEVFGLYTDQIPELQ